MSKQVVSLVRYEEPLESVRKALDLCGGLKDLGAGSKIFLKPNIVFWTREAPFPKWGCITTSRVVQDVVTLLAEHGVKDISIGEGMVYSQPGESANAVHAFETLGYNKLAQLFGVKVIDTFQRPFREVDLGQGMKLKFNVDALESDLVISLPVMKTHAQTVVSLGLKNLKGLIDVNSRKRCHSADPKQDLHLWVSRLAAPFKNVLNVIDGIYTAERGPGMDGTMHRSNLLAASWDLLSADKVGAVLLGHDPAAVPHLNHALAAAGRPLDMSDVEVAGESLDHLARRHEWTFPYTEDESLPIPMAKRGMSGVRFYKYDSTMCTYCSRINGVVLTAIAMAWKGQPWDEVEILTGKMMAPRPGAGKTILLGKCMYQAHKDNPAIAEMIPVKTCPPAPDKIVEALHRSGIMIDPAIILGMERLPGTYMARYKDKPEYDERLFQVA